MSAPSRFPPSRFVQLVSHGESLYALDAEGAVWERTLEHTTGAERRTVWAQVEYPRLGWPRT